MTNERNALGQLFAECWKDEALKQRFMSNPKEVLSERGIKLPDGININVVENTDNSVHITLPAPPEAHGELSDADLMAAVGGAGGTNAQDYTAECAGTCYQASCLYAPPCAQ